MADKRLNIKVRAEGAKKAKQQLKGVEGGLAKLGKAAVAASAAFFGAKMLLSAMQKFIQLSAQQELAERKLQIALGKTSQGLLNQASALQQVSTFGDEAIISQQAFLASLEFSEEQIKKIIEASINLSAATGISLESAVRNTAKTFSGLSGELGELIPQLRDLTAEQMKAGEAVALLSDLFEGQAEAQTKTLAGSIEQMKNAIGDSGEAMGDLFAPVVISVANNLKDAAVFTNDFLTGLKNIAEFGTAEGLEGVKKQSDRTVEGVQQLQKGVASLRRELHNLGVDLTSTEFKVALKGEDGKPLKLRDQAEVLQKMIPLAKDVLSTQKKTLEFRSLETDLLEEVYVPKMIEVVDHSKQAAEFAAQTASSMITSAVMGDNVAESLKRAVIQLMIMVAQAKIYKAIMSTDMFTGGGFFGGFTKFLFGASPTQAAPSPNVTINQNFGGMGVIDHNFAANSIIPAINKAVSTGQARITN